jgi:transcriptional pleiotropic regulator of transition state genes
MSQKWQKEVSKYGRITIPAEIRRELGAFSGSAVDISLKNDGSLLIEPHVNTCIFCGGIKDVQRFGRRHVCTDCVRRMAAEFGGAK